MSDLDNLSNKELLAKCREHGLPVVPITDTTRNVIIRRLQSAISKTPLNKTKKNTKHSRNVVLKNLKSIPKVVDPVKVHHGKITTKNTVNLKRRTVQTKEQDLKKAASEDDNEIDVPILRGRTGLGKKESHSETSQRLNLKRRTLSTTERSAKSVAESDLQANNDHPKLIKTRLNLGSKLNKHSLSLTKTSVSVTAYVHEAETPSEEEDPTPKRNATNRRNETNQNNEEETNLKRSTIHRRSVQFATSVSDASCQADMPSPVRETIYRKKETHIQNTRKPVAAVFSLGSQTEDDNFSKAQQSPLKQEDPRAKRIGLLTRSGVFTTSFIHQMETPESDDESNPGKRRRICTSPVSCPPPIYETSFGETFSPELNAVKPRLNQTKLKSASFLNTRSSLSTSQSALLAPRDTLSGSVRSLREESTFSIRKRQIDESTGSRSSIPSATTENTLYPKLDQFYKQSFPYSFRGEPMDTDQ